MNSNTRPAPLQQKTGENAKTTTQRFPSKFKGGRKNTAAARALTAARPVCNGPAHMSNADDEPARLTVRLGAIAANYRTFQRLSGRATVAGVVKADGYGCGALPAAKTLRDAGCDTYFVARLSEGIALRKAIGDARIFVLDGVQAQTVPAFGAYNLTPVLNSLDEIVLWSAAGKDARDAAIHIDTGMNRLGISREELDTLASEQNSRLQNIRLVLLMSHLACADDLDSRHESRSARPVQSRARASACRAC